MRALISGPHRFHSLDDLDVVDLARRDPEALVGGQEPVTLDEVHWEPDLLLAVERAMDRQPVRNGWCSWVPPTSC